MPLTLGSPDMPRGRHTSRGSTCVALGCKSNKKDNPELSFHSFPSGKERFKLWCDLIKRPDLNNEKDLLRCFSLRVCSLHFCDHMYMNVSKKTRLIWSALPSRVEIEISDHRTEDTEASSTFPCSMENSASSAKESCTVKCGKQASEQKFLVFSGSSHKEKNAAAVMSVKCESNVCIEKSVSAVGKSQDSCTTSETHTTTDYPRISSGSDTEQCASVKIIPPSKSVEVSLSKTMQSQQDDPQNVGSQPSVHFLCNTCTISKSSMSRSAVERWLENHCPESDPPSIDNVVTLENTPTRKINEQDKMCNEELRQDKCSALERREQKVLIHKPYVSRTYSGPVQRRVVKTEDGSKKTIMIVTKASLKNLQAKGLIRPVKRCTLGHLNASQALLKTSIIQSGSDRTKNRSDLGCENLVSRKDELSRQDSSLKESVTSCESQESRIDSRIDSNSDHPPIKVPCMDVSVPHTLPSAFSAEVNKSSETNHPPQQQTASSSIDPHCTVNQPRTQIKVTEDHNQASSINFSQINTRTSSKCKRLPPVIRVNIADSNIKVGGNREDNLTKTKPQSRDNVQWIAMPSAPVHQSESASSGTAAQECKTDSSISNKISPIAFTSSEKPGIIYKAVPLESLLKNGQKLHIPSNKSANKELKVKYSRLLRKHQYRYRRLLEKYKILEQNHLVVKEVGTPQQIIRDARKYLSEEHVLFLESQMFLKNRPGTGNRYSRKFVKLMIEYYKRSAAGYRYLKTIFTLPCVSTVVKWLNDPSVLGDSSDVPSGNGSDVVNPHSSLKICSSQNTSNSKFSERKAAVKNLKYEENLSNSERSEESSSEDD